MLTHVARDLLVMASAVALAASAACETFTDPEPLQPGDVLFEVEYVNHAWGFQWEGLVVDGQGKVTEFALEEPWPHAELEVVTAAQLAEKHTQGSRSRTQLSPGEVRERMGLLARARLGRLTDPVNRGADAGGVAYRAWVYDADDALYRPVLLREEGDWYRENTAPAADALVNWLKTLQTESGQI